MKRMLIGICVLGFGLVTLVSAVEPLEMMQPEKVRLGGHLGEQIDLCYDHWVSTMDPDYLVGPFKKHDQTNGWRSEFWGKWMLGAVPYACYKHDEAMKAKIGESVKHLMATQDEHGYIGDYTKAARTQGAWDIWGRKYTMLGLMKYYDLTGDEAVLACVKRVADNLMTDVGPGIKDIYRVGAYRGMASSSVLEPIVLLYNRTKDKRYLDFAYYIVSQWTEPDGADLIGKALKGVHVGDRFGHPSSWWSWENGMKAYEMMSCYQGLTELYQVKPVEDYMRACQMTADDIYATEIIAAGGASAYECWYHGKENQCIPAYHTMETCVTTTWMKYCQTMLAMTGEPRYGDWLEGTLYNAMLGALKADGANFAKYSPLEGTRFPGDGQCGMTIHCCSANGPRGFVAAMESIVMVSGDSVYVNLYCDSTVQTHVPGGDGELVINQETRYPEDGRVVLKVGPEQARDFNLKLRIPEWSHATAVTVNGKAIEQVRAGSYLDLKRKWKAGDEIELVLDLNERISELNYHVRLMRGPVVFARDVRFDDGIIDQACNFVGVTNGRVEMTAMKDVPEGMWMAMTAKMVLGTNNEGEGSKPEAIHFCDFASAGNTWDMGSYYRVWLREVMNTQDRR